MCSGKKSTAQGIVYGAFDLIKAKKSDMEPLEVFLQALEKKGYYNSCEFKPVDLIPGGGDFGSIHERIWAGDNAITLLPTLQAIHADGVFFGHSHVNDMSMVDNGIRWTYGLKTGQYDYHEKDKLGGTLITLSDDARTFNIEHIAIKE
jgi:hypothetical protein